MFLSQFEIAKAKVINPYEVHQYLWMAFRHHGETNRSFLFRTQWQPRSPIVSVLVQSKNEPKQPDADDIILHQTKEFNPQFKQGQMLRFALCGNPVKRLPQDRNRVPLSHEEEQITWLERKVASAAKIREVEVVSAQTIHFRKDIDGKRNHGKLLLVTFQGMLEIHDPNQLQTLLKDGIGAAKSFGCGLLTLARA